MTAATVITESSTMSILGRMAGGTAARHIVGIVTFVATGAGKTFVGSLQLEFGFVIVVEGPDCPRVGVMTAGTLGSQRGTMNIIGFMANHAIAFGFVKHETLVTALTRGDGMHPF